MKKQTALSASVLLGAMLLAGSCNDLALKGRQITFSTTSREAGTKTSYGDDYAASGSTFQFIDWTDGDKIRIVSDYATDPSGKHFADYRLENISRVTGTHQSQADARPTPNGLAWGDEQYYDFYSVYPIPGVGAVDAIVGPETLGYAETHLGKVVVVLPAEAGQYLSPSSTKKYLTSTGAATTAGASNLAYTYDVYKPDMNYAVLTACALHYDKNSAGEGRDVELSFEPAFTAFEFNMTSADQDLTVSKVELLCGDTEYLAGTYVLKAGCNLSDASAVDVSNPVSFPHSVSWTKEVSLTPASGATFTFFTIPKVNAGMLRLKVYTDQGNATLNLTKAGSTTEPYVFSPGKKYRINLLKVGGVWKYKISLDPDARPWDLIRESTTFSQNIQSSAFEIFNAKETGNNYYPAGTKDYQVRTLDLDNGKTYFEVTFQPAAPLGGYWQLIPESNGGLGTAAFRIEVWDGDDGIGSTDLKGQIMNQTVTLHITSVVSDEQRTEDHAIIIKSIFSTSASFDENSTFSADSEIQDVHRDGSFSYWRFVIPAKNN